MRKYDVRNVKLARAGRLRIEWASRSMPVVKLIAKRFRKEKPLKGIRVGACLHVTAETANLAMALAAGGASVGLCASNPLSTQDDVAASLVADHGISVFAKKGEDQKTYYRHLGSVLDAKPQVVMDDGADLISVLHSKRVRDAAGVFGGTEETTTGVIRLKSLQRSGLLRFPIIAVNDAKTKHLFDNRYGTGQSTIDGITRATNCLWSGSTAVVAGYGWCGRGVAMRAHGMGARVVVTEIDPLRALEAVMDGFEVMSMEEAARIGDIFVTLTGDAKVIGREHFSRMKNGAMIANSGHFNVEVDIPALEKMSKSVREMRPFVREYTIGSGKKIVLLGEGRLINLAAAEGHPAMVMDMSFANQALSCEYIAKNRDTLQRKVYAVPEHLDELVARLKLNSRGVKIDVLTAEQKKYLSSWEMGT